MTRAVVVGSGPNGLSAALTLADQGLEVTVLEAADTPGGGTRSSELTLPGLVHDECSGFHPLAVDNAFTRHFDLAAHGLRWRWPEVQYAHPLDGGRGASAWLSVERTAAALGPDERAWLQVFGPVSRRFDAVAEDFLRPALHVPTHPVALASFGARALAPAAVLARRFRTPEARALFAGAAAHAMRPLSSPLTSAIGLALGASAHRYGWPVAEGGSASISRAVTAMLTELGGRVETGVEVTSLDQLGDADVVMLDVAPAAAARIVGDRLPARVRRAYERYRHGPGAFKLDLAVEGGVPWSHPGSRRAGTVHVGGTLTEVARAEREVDRGRMPERPFVLVGQQHLADPGRSRDGVHPVYAYAHVPSGWDGDPAVARDALLGQLERFAPGVRERVVAEHVTTPRDWERLDANFVGGDVVTGANTARQLLLRPRPALDPYATGVDGVYLCSAATPPGAGAHGMCGWNAARSALRRV
ncbi:MAG: Phytoene dehydrogenase [Marmoricola sp.]|nr:Phytoene dehydrogenase [Marmoricola sp.]